MISRRSVLAGAAATVAAATLDAVPAAAVPASGAVPTQGHAGHTGHDGLRVTAPTVEYVPHPLGLDAQRPRLSWPLASDKPGMRQSAYQIRVATSTTGLSRPDVWDSGQVMSGESVLVPYGGPELRPRTRYFWSVRVWDADGRASGWSEPSWWETGLMKAGQWTADWISAPASLTDAPSLEGSSWIWFPEGDPTSSVPAVTRWFRGIAGLPGGITAATLVISADDAYAVSMNGVEVARTDPETDIDGWRRPAVIDVLDRVHSGDNVIAVSATNASPGPAGLIAVLTVRTASGEQRTVTDASWKAMDKEPPADWRGLGFDDAHWPAARVAAPWGEGPWGRVVPVTYAVTQLRHEFRLRSRKVSRARLYATALGLYEAHLNGSRVGSDQLAPGWTDYRTRLPYQTYDVTSLLRPGANAVGVYLAPGWYAGDVGMFGPHQYGEHPALLAQLEVEYADGTSERITSGDGWRAASGAIVAADLHGGETYDARKETPGWTSPGFDDRGWLGVRGAGEVGPGLIVAQEAGPVRVAEELTPKKVTEPRPGVFVFDLGQNMVGSVRLRVSGAAGTTVRLRHAEVLNPDGTVYTANLRSAAATDTYTLKGHGEESFEPRFTVHGFRYVEVTGFPGTPSAKAVTGRVMYTSAPSTLDFETDVPMLNQLHHNITWGQRGNFLSVPTDTPARDERLGWTGDINVFAPTAAYTMESARFLSKWLVDLRDAQTAEGAFTNVAPDVGGLGGGTAGWGDAGVTVPWSLYQAYGDRQVLMDAWPSVQAWLTYLEKHSDRLLRPAEGYGDWLNVDDETPKDVIATAYFAHSADLAARMATELGKDPASPRGLFERVREAFRSAYVSADGRVKGDTQTAYVLALSMDLMPDGLRKAAADRLVALIEARDWHLSTGFLGTPRLLPVLTDAGHTDVAHRLLQQRSFPSWGYQIDRGATTMWERWDSLRTDGSFQDPGMNSFNHYAYGSVGEWMYANIAGISAGRPGYREIVIRPRPGGAVTTSRATFTSVYGPVSTQWRQQAGRFTLTCTVPPNTTAEVWIPASTPKEVTHTHGTFLRRKDGCAVYRVGSGTHRFTT
ncbi:alpha-L-rhamnosidase [Streptomyces nodosus]|uniref:alpha-L-rhamnosidase n=1 Tax=Streptomyces nodosus TaxID=40318 RepID=A0A0B5DDJ2_9ACTN|nr:alpha-L-rhamnosidase [Streptomyces nodosus]AJE41658.1 rhamnosidase [Streptomyces nodosus]MBB4792870.1 alpha-L-rhamnosidase [Streptomyces nodosus]QEV40193.1 rhamnosidase [Streptomyces nodosus]